MRAEGEQGETARTTSGRGRYIQRTLPYFTVERQGKGSEEETCGRGVGGGGGGRGAGRGGGRGRGRGGGGSMALLYGAGSSLASSLFHDAIDAYTSISAASWALRYTSMDEEEAVCRLSQWSDTCALSDQEAFKVHWAEIESLQVVEKYSSDAHLQTYPTLAWALVPVYNLPNLTASDPPLILTRELLADIFYSRITRWDDERIAQLNPALVNAGKLPAADIRVVVTPEGLGTTDVFQRALAKFDQRTVGSFSGPAWANASVHTCATAEHTSYLCVMNSAFSIGYATLSEVMDLSLPAVSIQEAASGVVVSASPQSVRDALLELNSNFEDGGSGSKGLTMDLTGAISSAAWPICGITYLVMSTNISTALGGDQDRCDQIGAISAFWLWFFTSDAVIIQTQAKGYVELSPLMRQLIVDRLEADILCNGVRVHTGRQVVRGAGADWVRSDLLKFISSYERSIVSYEASGVNTARSQVEAGTLDYGIVHDDELTAGLAGTALVVIPYRIVGLAVAYSLCDVASDEPCALAEETLVLDLNVLAAVLSGNLTRWLDPRLVALNPWMDVEPHASVIGAHREIVLIGEAATSDTSDLLMHKIRRHVPSATLDAFAQGGRASIRPSSRHVRVGIRAQPFSLGVVPLSDELGDLSLAPIVSPFDSTLLTIPSAQSISACVDTSGGEPLPTHDELTPWHVEDNTVPACYPIADTVVVVTRRDYTREECATGQSTLAFLTWLLQKEVDLPHPYMPSYMDLVGPELVMPRLNWITCAGVSIAESLIDRKPMGVAVKVIVYVPASLRILFLIFAAGIFAWHRKTATVKTAQRRFLFITALGCVMLLCVGVVDVFDFDDSMAVAGVPLGQPGRYPTLDIRCRVQVWCFFVGHTLVYAPLVTKLWRVTVLLINPEMRDVRVRAWQFIKYVGALVLVDVILLVAWMLVAPPFYRVESFLSEGAGDAQIWHASCDILPSGSIGFALALFIKQMALIGFGIRLCNRARRLDKAYSDAQSMSFLLSGHMERSATLICLGWFLWPFVQSGTPVGFFLLKWLTQLAGVLSTTFFIFIWRLDMLVDELRCQGKGCLPKRTISSSPLSSVTTPLPSRSARSPDTCLRSCHPWFSSTRVSPHHNEPALEVNNNGTCSFRRATNCKMPQFSNPPSLTNGKSVSNDTKLAHSSLRVVQENHESTRSTSMPEAAASELEELREDITELRSRNLDLSINNGKLLARIEELEEALGTTASGHEVSSA